MTRSTRFLLGVAAGALVAGGGAALLWGGGSRAAEVMIRVGIVLASVWLVAPLIRRPSRATALALIAAALVVIRPRLLAPLLVAAVLWWLSARKREA